VATGATVLPVKLEVEPAPARSGDLPGAEVPPLGNRPGGAAAFVIPAEISLAWWLEHRHLFEWSERQKALVLLPDRGLAGEAAAFADPPPAPPPGSSPRERLEGFIGQESAVRNLRGLVAAAKLRGEVPAPALLAGPSGLGKTTLANLAARDLGTRLQVGAGPALADFLALLRLLVSLRKGDVLFIDEIHGLPTAVAECLYQAIDEWALSILFICGSEARLVKLRLERFFLIGATTEEAQLPKPFHSRFALRERLDLYTPGELAAIAVARGKALGVEVTPEAAETLAHGSRGTPRELLAAVSTARDEAQVAAGRADGVVITREFAEGALRSRGIDRFGLSEMDRRILRALHERGGAIGLRTLADLLGENPRAILEVHEPYLLRAGWIGRTRRGRVLTEKARRVVAGLISRTAV
jgi:Holliday junction DNA helicase RuvB